MDNRVGEEILHNSLGVGKIIAQDEKFITVKIKNREEPVKFKFPDPNYERYFKFRSMHSKQPELNVKPTANDMLIKSHNNLEAISLEERIAYDLKDLTTGIQYKLKKLRDKYKEIPGYISTKKLKEALHKYGKSLIIGNDYVQLISYNEPTKKAHEKTEKEELPKSVRERVHSLVATDSTHHSDEEDQVLFDDLYDYTKSNFWSYIAALDKEKDFVKRMGGKKCHLENGTFISEDSRGFNYSFEKEDDQYYPDDGQIRILDLPYEFAWGSIVASDENIVNIRTQAKLETDSDGISIDFMLSTFAIIDNLTAHVRNIIKRVEEDPKQNKILYKLLHNYAKNPKYISEGELATGQKRAIARSHKNDILFIWGPPGTGKTYTLSKLAIEHMEKEERVLMLSNSNVAVDGAALKVKKNSAGKFKRGTILRYGYPHMSELIEDDEITSYCVAAALNRSISDKLKSLYKEKEKLTKKDKRYSEIVTETKKLKDTLKRKEKDLVHDARFIATTVAKACMDKLLFASKFDVVIVDEASMLLVPQVIFAASLASKHFVCVGDFRQLPPIVTSDKENRDDDNATNMPSVLNNDIYDFTGIKDIALRNQNHKWIVMLNKQHRMNPGIAQFLSLNMYMRKLESSEEMEDKTNPVKVMSPAPNMAMAIADTTGMLTTFQRTGSGSYFNILSAFASFALAQGAAEKVNVGIITPYREQARLISSMVKDVNESGRTLRITSSTVHSFQGSEQDIIIYDVPDCYIRPYPTQMLSDNKNLIADRLFNVAMSRAKGKFIAVMNYEYLKGHLNKDRLFTKYFDNRKTVNHVINAKSIFESNGSKLFTNYSQETATKLFNEDLKKAEKTILMYIPGLLQSDWTVIKQLIDSKQECKVTIYVEDSKVPKEIDNAIFHSHVIIKHKGVVMNPITIIDGSIIWYGKPFVRADFVSQADDCHVIYRPVFRFVGDNTAKKIKGLL